MWFGHFLLCDLLLLCTWYESNHPFFHFDVEIVIAFYFGTTLINQGYGRRHPTLS